MTELHEIPELWEHQREPVEQVVRAFQEGAKVVVLDAPTGSGKTIIAEHVRRRLGVRGSYVATDKGLQAQLLRTFDYAKVLKGRANYPTLRYPNRFKLPKWDKNWLTADDCNSAKDQACTYCEPMHACPYRLAKGEAQRANLSCLNTAYALREWNGPGGMSGWPLVILDECDRLEDDFLSYMEAKIGPRRLDKLKLRQPESVGAMSLQWVEEAERAVTSRLTELLRSGDQSVPARRELRSLQGLSQTMGDVAEGFGVDWVCTECSAREGVVFRPVFVGPFGKTHIWNHADRWLLMSATVIDSVARVSELGWEDLDQVRTVTVPSIFPVERRPIFQNYVANMASKTRVQELPMLIEELVRMLRHHQDDRGVIHTGTYQINRAVTDGLRQHSDIAPRLIPYVPTSNESEDDEEKDFTRDEAVEELRRRHAGVLLGPSVERGVDLPNDDCRFVAICRMPFAYRGDPRIMLRQTNDPSGFAAWEATRGISSIVQMTGRGMRHKNDWCISYLLDDQFKRIFRNPLYYRRIPEYWAASLRTFMSYKDVPRFS